MRFGQGRGMRIAALALGALAIGLPAKAGDLFHFRHSIPREVLAQDYRTGGMYFAPPIPYGHYAKDDYVGCIHGALAGAHGMIGKLCSQCFGKGCDACGGQGCLHGDPCGSCGGKGCGACGNRGLFGHHKDNCSTCAGLGGLGVGSGHVHGGDPGHGLGLGHGHGGGLCGDPGCGSCGGGVATAQMLTVAPTPQAVVPACGGCGQQGCGLCGGLKNGLLSHGGGGKHGLGHGGLGHGGLGHGGLGLNHGHGGSAVMAGGDPGCGDPGCGLCKGGGLLGHGQGGGDPACRHCFGKGCGHCLGLFDHGLLKSGLNHFFGPKVEYFVGPGGPVPITPGYVPWVNPVRSPRDFFAFPPFVDRAF